MKKRSILLLVAVWVYLPSAGQALITFSTDKQAIVQTSSAFPTQKGWVNDFENILSESEEQQLTSILTQFKNQTSNEIAIATVDTLLQYTDIQNYATDLGNFWGVGQKNKDNGLLIVVSKYKRKIGIATGVGTQKIITDTFCQKVINQTMIPYFRESKYYQGLEQAIREITEHWK